MAEIKISATPFAATEADSASRRDASGMAVLDSLLAVLSSELVPDTNALPAVGLSGYASPGQPTTGQDSFRI